jgi:hypothetical protein
MRALAWAMGLVTAVAFAALALAMLASESRIWVPALATLITLIAVQLAFMGGIQSGIAIARENDGRAAAWALLLGWVPALGGLLVFWLRTTGMQLACAIALFLVTFAIDAWLVRRQFLPRWFLPVRGLSTLVALAACALGLWRA